MNTALVVGASGSIGRAMVAELDKDERFEKVVAVSRNAECYSSQKVEQHTLDAYDDRSVTDFCDQLQERQLTITLAVCCIGILHDDEVFPEKKLEDVSSAYLQHYFAINTVIPAMWLRALVSVMPQRDPAVVAVLSARVGSISDNRLGGWYGYRCSKAALNMFVKTAHIEYQRRAKGTALVAYHPGTVDSTLSEPFQKNVPDDKLFAPEFTAKQFLKYTRDLKAADGPYYLDWQGQPIDW